MAIAYGGSLGFGSQTGSGDDTTVQLTTSAAVPSGGKIILAVSHYQGAATASGGGLTWTTDYSYTGTGDTNRKITLISANAPSGLSSGTTITITFSVSAFARTVSGAYFTGVADTSYTDGTAGGGDSSGSAGAWATAAVNTTNADDLLIGASWTDGGGGSTNTPGTNWSEANDNYASDPNVSLTMMYQIVSATGSYTASGTWSPNDPIRTQIIGAYKAAAGAVTGSSTFPITVTVGSAGTGIQTLNPSADSADGNWTTDTGGTSLAAAIDEDSASDSDYIRSEFAPSNSGCRVKLESASDPTSSAGHIIRWRTGKNATGGATINMTVKLMQGGSNVLGAGTQIASFNRNNVDSLTTYAETLSGGEADAITDYSDLYLEFYANQA